MRLASLPEVDFKHINFNVSDIVSTLTSLKPDGANGAYGFKWDYLLENIIKKYPFDSQVTDSERKQRAFDKLLECEDKCALMNRQGLPHSTGGVVYIARRLILSFLGTEPNLQLFDCSSFSGGASTSRKRKEGHPIFKYVGFNSKTELHVTKRAYPYALAYIGATPLWCEQGGYSKLRIVPGNTVTTVPKTNEIDRPIAKEPDMNMLLQRAVGGEIRKRLKRGISYTWFDGTQHFFSADLNDQSINRNLARTGSITGDLATIDLSSASDMISHLVVWELLPPKWYELLNDLRCDFGYMEDSNKLIAWEKFSAMGCGFTFELESLIFFALIIARAYLDSVAEPVLSVYGDDIICNSENAHNVMKTLKDFGFEPNLSKSFLNGPFRESCGGHYYEGYDVTPFYLKKRVDTPSRLCHFLNRLRRWSECEITGMCDPTVYDLWASIIKSNPFLKHLRGGLNLDRVDYIVSPRALGGIKYRLSDREVRVKASGWKSFLALKQDTHYGVVSCSNTITIDKHGKFVKSFRDSHEFVVNTELLFFTLVENEEYNFWGNQVKLFPQELPR